MTDQKVALLMALMLTVPPCMLVAAVQVAAGKATTLKDSLSSGSAEPASALNEIQENLDSISERFFSLDETILRKIMDIKDSTFVLSETSKDLNSRNQVIQSDVRKISEISREALLGIKEIDIGTKEVLGSMVRVRTISSESRDCVQDLTEAIAGFRTR
jgi:methyl-accepting chemotaxis protein